MLVVVTDIAGEHAGVKQSNLLLGVVRRLLDPGRRYR